MPASSSATRMRGLTRVPCRPWVPGGGGASGPAPAATTEERTGRSVICAASRSPLPRAGQGQPDGRAGAGARVELDLTAERPHGFGHDRQSEAEPASVAALAAVEAVEDPVLLRCGDAAPGVLHFDDDGAARKLARREDDPPLLGVLDGVGGEVRERLLDEVAVSEGGQPRRAVDLELGRRPRAELGRDLLEERPQLDRLDDGYLFARLRAGEHQERAGQPAEPAGLALDV